jgi:FkbM family methyltransferase
MLARSIGKNTMVRSVHNYRLHLDTHDPGLSRTLFLFGKREIDHYLMLQSTLRPGMNILDIGANIGYYAIMESIAIGPSGKVLAVEPVSSNIKMLNRNIDLNSIPNIDVLHGAVSSHTGTAKMFMSTRSNLHTFHSEGSAASYLNPTPVNVPTFTLKDVIADNTLPDLIRMDVEGHEVEILRQLGDLAHSDGVYPSVIFETHLTRYTDDNDFTPILKRLFKMGYKVVQAASSNESGSDKITRLGYKGSQPFYSDFGTRVIFENIKDDDAINAICQTGGLRTVLIAKIT